MTLRLSHSQAMKRQDCSKAWDYHYVQRIRPVTTSSALLFGNILDSAVEEYLNNRNVADAHNLLLEMWTEQEINGVKESLYDCTKIVYSNADYDQELLHTYDLNKLKDEHGEDVLDQIKSVYKQKTAIGFDYLKHDKKVLLNKANWMSMLRKGELMLDKAIELIDENVEDVLATQVKVNLENGEGDSIIGFADFVVKWKGYEQPIIFDLKTSSIDYAEDSAKKSPQLSLYLHDLRETYNTNTVGYMVLHKRVKKERVKICSKCGYDGSKARHKTCSNEIDGERCHGEWKEEVKFYIKHQIIIDEPSEIIEEMVMENMDAVCKSIKSGIVTRNLNACMKPWGPCPYIKLCMEKNSDGLMEMPEKEKK